MEKDVFYETVCVIYPGTHVPVVKEEEFLSALKLPHDGGSILPPVNVTELADLFKVEVAIPGVKREDFLIHADDNILSVCVMHKEPGNHDGEIFQQHEFNYECFDRHIILPDNADADFISAEYAAGILYLHVPKTKQPAKNLHNRIVVY